MAEQSFDSADTQYLRCTSAFWSQVKEGTGTVSLQGVPLRATAFATLASQTNLRFDTAALPKNVSVTKATLNLVISSEINPAGTWGLLGFYHPRGAALDAGDWLPASVAAAVDSKTLFTIFNFDFGIGSLDIDMPTFNQYYVPNGIVDISILHSALATNASSGPDPEEGIQIAAGTLKLEYIQSGNAIMLGAVF